MEQPSLDGGGRLKGPVEQNISAFPGTQRRLFISHRGQNSGGHGDWLEQESGEHVNELSSAHFNCLPV